MATCEWCWKEASKMGALLGRSTVEEYEWTLSEQDKLGVRAACPEARANAIAKLTRP